MKLSDVDPVKQARKPTSKMAAYLTRKPIPMSSRGPSSSSWVRIFSFHLLPCWLSGAHTTLLPVPRSPGLRHARPPPVHWPSRARSPGGEGWQHATIGSWYRRSRLEVTAPQVLVTYTGAERMEDIGGGLRGPPLTAPLE